MKNSVQYLVFGLLLVSAISLSILVPGGPIETRDFSHINPLILGSFNIFLTTLSLTSFLLLYFVWQRQRWAFTTSAVCAIAYCLVYILDLAHWFPVSPDAMPPALLAIEVWGMIISIPLAVLSVNGVILGSQISDNYLQNSYSGSALTVGNAAAGRNQKVVLFAVATTALILGVGVVIFATRSAMGLVVILATLSAMGL